MIQLQPNFLLVRIFRGIASHFTMRWTEWAMLWPAFGMWFGLQIDPEMFSKSPSFGQMAAWADESTWGIVFGIVMVSRLAALGINGTFKGFEFSPHIRAAASLLGVGIWSQAALGFLSAYLFLGGAFANFVLFTLPVILEMMNTYRSWRDVGAQFPVDG